LSQHLPILNEKAANNLQAVLRSINESHEQKGKELPPIHPGEILREDFLAPLGLSMNELVWICAFRSPASPKLSMNAVVLP